MKCQVCGNEIQEHVKFCPKCGNKVEHQPVVQTAQNNAFSHDISTVWPEWQIEKQLGKGSYGVVYQAIRRDNNVESRAAIKIISIPSDSSEIDSLRSEGLDMNGTRTYFKGIVDDFASEIQLMESLKGIQNIVSVEDYKVVEKRGAIGWDIYIRMELLTPFNTYICDKTLTEEEIVKLGTDICTALEICSKRNIIHRDIKPENIFVNDFGYFKLGDFGIARKLENMTGGLSQKGTFNYMAPEVANSNEYDARVDTYSLGIVLYRLLNNNKLPFLNTDKQLLNPNERKLAIERRIRGEALPVPCNASPSMANLILHACAHNPNARFASATEMKQALMSVANGTYTIVDTSLDKTTSVRSADVNYDATTAVRKATETVDQNEHPVINTFGEAPKKKKSKGKKGKFVAISILSGVVALAIALAVVLFSSAAYGVYRDMNLDNFDDALSGYHSEVEEDFIQEVLLDVLLKNRVDKVAAAYENGEVDYDTSIAELKALEEMGFDGAKEKIDEITVANDSANALANADEYYENGDYENAISEYSKIPETNEHYEEAQNKLTQVYADYINSTIETAKKHNSSKEYKQAVQVINIAYDVLPDSVNTTELDTVKEESFLYYKNDLLSKAEKYVSSKDYKNALSVLDDELLKGDSDITAKRQSYAKEYEDYCIKEADSLMKDYHHDQAIDMLTEAKTVLPDSTTVADKLTEVQKKKPIDLFDTSVLYDGTVFWKILPSDESTFSMGSQTYSEGFLLGCDHSLFGEGDGFALFDLQGNYSAIKFEVGRTNEYEKQNVKLQVFLDDKMVDEYSLNSDSPPKEMTIKLNKAKSMKLKITGGSRVKYGFANVKLIP